MRCTSIAAPITSWLSLLAFAYSGCTGSRGLTEGRKGSEEFLHDSPPPTFASFATFCSIFNLWISLRYPVQFLHLRPLTLLPWRPSVQSRLVEVLTVIASMVSVGFTRLRKRL